MNWKRLASITTALCLTGLSAAPPTTHAQNEVDISSDLWVEAVLIGEVLFPTVRNGGGLDVDAEVVPPVDFLPLENPFGLEVDAPPNAIVATHAAAVALNAPGGQTNVSLYPDGGTQSGLSFTHGASDDAFATEGPAAAIAVRADLPLPDDALVDFAVLATQAGFVPSTADEFLDNDPNAGSTHRYGINLVDGVWSVTFEQWDATVGAWQLFDTPAESRVDVQPEQVVVTFILPHRFATGLERLEGHVTYIPGAATNPAEAFVTRAEFALPLPVLDPFAPSIIDRQFDRAVAATQGDLEAAQVGFFPEVPTADEPAPGESSNDPSDRPADPVDELAGTPDAQSEPEAREPLPESATAAVPTENASDDAAPTEQPTEQPVQSSGDDGGGLSPIVPLGAAAVLGLVGGGVVLGRRRKPSPLPITADERAGAPTTPTPSPLADSFDVAGRVDDLRHGEPWTGLDPVVFDPDAVNSVHDEEAARRYITDVIRHALDAGVEIGDDGTIIPEPIHWSEAFVGYSTDDQIPSAGNALFAMIYGSSEEGTYGDDRRRWWIHGESFSFEKAFENRDIKVNIFSGERSVVPPVELVEPMMGSVSDAVKES